MELIDKIAEMRARSEEIRASGQTIGFVPTMGFLHEGHLSLMRQARERCDVLVISIFVNPAQFGPREDLDRYPRDLDRDLALAKDTGVDIVFFPSAPEVYPPGYQTYISVENLSQGLCGASRPGFFRGVATVVAKLFNQVRPHVAVFGEKDYQQLAVVRRMVEDLDMGVEIVPGPTVRESDGLAMSSRNTYLTEEGRTASLCLYKSIQHAREMVSQGIKETDRIISDVIASIENEPLARIDYVEIRHPLTLEPISLIDPQGVMLLAVWVENTRLIDNGLLPE